MHKCQREQNGGTEASFGSLNPWSEKLDMNRPMNPVKAQRFRAVDIGNSMPVVGCTRGQQSLPACSLQPSGPTGKALWPRHHPGIFLATSDRTASEHWAKRYSPIVISRRSMQDIGYDAPRPSRIRPLHNTGADVALLHGVICQDLTSCLIQTYFGALDRF